MLQTENTVLVQYTSIVMVSATSCLYAASGGQYYSWPDEQYCEGCSIGLDMSAGNVKLL